MRLIPAVLLALGLVACAGGGQSGVPAPNRELLTADELRGHELSSVYEVLEKLRPEWLRSRGRMSPTRPAELPVVFLDNSRYGELAVLRTLRVGDVVAIQRLSGPEATQRFGTGYPAGVIHVFTR